MFEKNRKVGLWPPPLLSTSNRIIRFCECGFCVAVMRTTAKFRYLIFLALSPNVELCVLHYESVVGQLRFLA